MSPDPFHAGPRRRCWVWIALALAIVLDTLTQLVWKIVVMRLPALGEGPGAVATLTSEPLILLLCLLFVAQFVNWMFILAKTDVSYSQPITALSYVTVAALSMVCLGERMSVAKAGGIGLILTGVWLISTTPMQTILHPAARPNPAAECKP